MISGIKAARDYLTNSTSALLRGFTLEIKDLKDIMDNECDPNKATRQFIGGQSGQPPAVIVGGGCTFATVALNVVAEAKRIPVVGTIASSGRLSSKRNYVRYARSDNTFGELAAAIAHSINLQSIGAVAESDFDSIINHLDQPQLEVTSCAHLTIEENYLEQPENIKKRLDRMYKLGCR